jgi:hypothetical protein
MAFCVYGCMNKPEAQPNESVLQQLHNLEDTMSFLLNRLTPAERISYLNAMIVRMYSSPRKPVSSAEKIQLVLAHRKGSSLSAEQQERIKMLSELTNRLYDLENGSND